MARRRRDQRRRDAATAGSAPGRTGDTPPRHDAARAEPPARATADGRSREAARQDGGTADGRSREAARRDGGTPAEASARATGERPRHGVGDPSASSPTRPPATAGRPAPRRPRWLAWAAVAAVAAAVLYVGVSQVRRAAYAARLPALPELSGQPPALREHLEAADRAARDRPMSAEAVGALGIAYHADLFLDHADRAYAAAEALSGGAWRWTYYRALAAGTRGDTGGLADGMRRVVADAPDFGPAWWRLGEAEFKAGRYDRAAEAWRRALPLAEPAPAAGAGARGAEADAAGPGAEAGAAGPGAEAGAAGPGAEAGAAGPGAEAGAAGPGAESGAAGPGAEAGAAGPGAESGAAAPPTRRAPGPPVSAYAALGLARVALVEGDARAAADQLEGVTSEAPGFGPAFRLLADAYATLGRADDAARAVRTADRLPRYDAYLDPLSETLIRESRSTTFLLQQAATADLAANAAWREYLIRRALEFDPDHAVALAELVTTLRAVRRYEEALELLERRRRERPDDFGVLADIGRTLSALGRYAEAEETLRRALEGLDDAPTRYELGLALDEAGRPSEAIAEYRRALDRNPNHPESLNNLGAALANQGRMDEAARHFERLIAVDPENADAHANLGFALAAAGARARAIAAFREALRLDPDHAEARGALQDIEPR